jgi:transcription elongation GreA/GreB family factor
MTQQPQADGPPPPKEEVVHLLALVRGGQADDLEAAWLAAVESEALSFDDLAPVLEELASQHQPKVMESLVWLLLSTRAEQQGPETALDAAWDVRDLLPDSDVLRQELADLYCKVYADTPGIETLAEMTVGRADVPLRDALPLMEKFLGLPPGTYVSDSRRRSPGRVTGVDADRKVLAVSFGESDRAYDATSVEALEVLAADDYRALAVFDRPRLALLAQDDPTGLVRLVLKAYGPRMGFRDLKGRLADVAVRAEGWSRWWSAARALVMHDPLVEMSEGTQPEFFLRARPVTYEVEARERFDAAAAVEDKLLVVVGYLNEAGHDPAAEAEMLKGFAADLARLVAPESAAAPADQLATAAVLAEVGRHLAGSESGDAGPGEAGRGALAEEAAAGRGARREPGGPGRATPVPASLPASPGEVAALLGAIRANDLAALSLALVHREMPQAWAEAFAAAMPAMSQEMCDRIAADLAEAGRPDLVASAAREIMRQPNQSLAALAWLWKNATTEKYAQAFADLSRASMTVRLFQAANELALTDVPDKARKQDLLQQVRRAISGKDFGTLRDILDHTDADWAKEIRTAVSRNTALSDHLRVQVLDVLAHAHPVPVARMAPPWEEDVVYTTPAALEARQKEFDHLVSVKMMENSKAIGEAAAHGDISENAEFTAALEERDHLTERANAMQADLARAKPISSSLIHSETANIGTTVRARRQSTGQEETLTFLGPWDADVHKGIYYYKAPLALAFMGKAAGETVTLRTDSGEERWEVLEVRPAL